MVGFIIVTAKPETAGDDLELSPAADEESILPNWYKLFKGILKCSLKLILTPILVEHVIGAINNCHCDADTLI